MTSHDDGQPFDKERTQPFKTANMLLLTPGTSQVYYGDESARDLTVAGTIGDATLRSFMNWDAISENTTTKQILNHWQKLGQFRANHMAIGAGRHKMISNNNGLIFSRTRNEDKVLIGLNLTEKNYSIDVSEMYENGDEIRDTYSNKLFKVNNGTLNVITENEIFLLERI